MRHFFRCLSPALLALLSACASAPPAPATAPDAPRPALATAPAVSANTLAQLAAARAQVGKARAGIRGFTDADSSLAQAEQAAAEGNNPRAQSLARQAEARAGYALQAQATRRAAAELQALYATTGLSDVQLAQMRAAEAALIRGESSLALTRLQGLRKAVRVATRTHTVGRGETLSAIAARAEVYGNSLLWPLIWQANKATLPDPHKLRAGQQLVIPANPSVEQVVKAIELARQNPARVKVGPVVPVP